jgi:cytochrome c2
MVRHLMIGAIVLAASAGHALAQGLPAGEASFRKCQPCHDVGEAAKNNRSLGLSEAVWSRRQEEKSMNFERVTQGAVAQH